MTNTDSSSHPVSLRTQLDTLLGTNDGAPVRIPNVGSITKDHEFRHNSPDPTIAEYSAAGYARRSLTSPKIIADDVSRHPDFRNS